MATDVTRGVTIRMSLVDGTPQGLRTVERMGWTGSLKKKDSWTRAYVLTTKDDSLDKAHTRYLEARLPAEMETYLDNVLPLFPLMGVGVFERPEEIDGGAGLVDGTAVDDADAQGPRLYLKTRLAQAEGEDRSHGFLVFAGGRGRRETKGDADEEFLFDSPSAAASVLSGGNKDGRAEWKDARGRTLRAIQEASAS